MSPDLINGIFEAVAGLMVWINVRVLIRDKTIKGVSLIPTAVFFLWGIWNLFYYPHLDQMFSFFGGILVVSGNLAWVALAMSYKHKIGRSQ